VPPFCAHSSSPFESPQATSSKVSHKKSLRSCLKIMNGNLVCGLWGYRVGPTLHRNCKKHLKVGCTQMIKQNFADGLLQQKNALPNVSRTCSYELASAPINGSIVTSQAGTRGEQSLYGTVSRSARQRIFLSTRRSLTRSGARRANTPFFTRNSQIKFSRGTYTFDWAM
jgi:hypothetical protein